MNSALQWISDNITNMHPVEVASLLGDHSRPCPKCGGIVRLRNANEGLASLPQHWLALSCTKCSEDFLLINVLPD